MKSTTFAAAAAALLASVAVAQPHAPHGHQRRHKHANELEKRELVVEWETVWETATVYVDETSTETVLPEKTPEPEPKPEAAAPTTSTGIPGQFFQTPSEQPTTLATSTSSAAPPPPPSAPPAETTTEAPPAPAPTTSSTTSTTSTYSTSSTSTPQPESTSAAAPIISVPAISVAPPVVAPTPTTSSSAEAPTTTSAAPPPAQTSGGSSGGGGGSTGVSGQGDITYYTVGMGACGYDDSGDDDSQNIVAMPVGMWEAVSSATNLGVDMPAHPWCDKTITITANGKTAQAKIRDQCPGCSGGSIDVSAHTFLALYGSLDVGRGKVEWTLNA